MEIFSELLEASFAERDLVEDALVEGTVIAMTRSRITVDIGLKTDGDIHRAQFGKAGYDGSLKPGDRIGVIAERICNEGDRAVLNRAQVLQDRHWSRLEACLETGGLLEGVIYRKVRGGFAVDLDGAIAFLPRSQSGVRPLRSGMPPMNRSLKFKIMKMNKCRGNIVVSRHNIDSGATG